MPQPTAFSPAYNDLELLLSAPYTPGTGNIAFVDLSALPANQPTQASPLRLTIARRRDGAKTILTFTGRNANVLSGAFPAEGYPDIPLDAGDSAQCRPSAGYVNELQTAVKNLELTQGSGINLLANPHEVAAGPVSGTDANRPTWRPLDSSDLPVFAPPQAGIVPVPSAQQEILPPGNPWRYLDEFGTWTDPLSKAVLSARAQPGGDATADSKYGSNEQTMLQKVYDALRYWGMLN